MEEKKSYENEPGILKFGRGSLFEGALEVYVHSIPDTDVVHAVSELREAIRSRGLQVGTQQEPSVMSYTDEALLLRAQSLAAEAKHRAISVKLADAIRQYMPSPSMAVPAVRVDLTDQEMAMVESGRKIPAIKALRSRTDLGLRDAKDACDAYEKKWNAAGSPRGGIPNLNYDRW
jgi:ribosomal protein L7/L12